MSSFGLTARIRTRRGYLKDSPAEFRETSDSAED